MKDKQIYKKVYNSFNQEYSGWRGGYNVLKVLFGSLLIAWGVIMIIAMIIKEIRVEEYSAPWYIYLLLLILIRVGYHVLTSRNKG